MERIDRPHSADLFRAARDTHLAVIAGSGMGSLAESFVTTAVMPFEDLQIGACGVEGHVGEIRRCRDGDNKFTIVLGRRHLYENGFDDMQRIISWLSENGVTHLLVTSAAGSLKRSSPSGEFVVVTDTMDFQNRKTIGANGMGGFERTRVDSTFTCEVEAALRQVGAPWSRGTLACGAGPTYETPAEVGFFQFTGASLVTMSLVPELLCANRCGMTVAALGLLTNPGTGIAGSIPGHNEVLEAARHMSDHLARVVSQLSANKQVSR